MSKILVLLVLLFCVSSALAQTPTLVQVATNHDWIYSMQSPTSLIASGDTLSVNFPNGTGAGNLGVLVTGIDDTASTPTIADDKSNTWTLSKKCVDTNNGEDILLYTAPNMAAGTRKITITYNAAASNSGPPDVAEFTNVATSNPVDATSCNFGATTSVTAGSATPTGSGDLVIQYTWNDTLNLAAGAGQGVHYTAGNGLSGQGNITWAKFIDGWWWAAGAQWGVLNQSTAFNPAMTVSTAGFVSLAVFLKKASAGTAPSGMRVVALQNVPNGTTSPFNVTSITTYFPCPSTANLLVANYATGNHDLTAVSDSHSNTWTSNHAKFCDAGNNTCLHTYFAGNATLSADMNVVLTYDAAAQDSTLLYCIAGAATAPKDTTVVNSGNQSVAGNLTIFNGTVTPSTSNGVVLVTTTQELNTTTGFTGANQNYVGCFESSQNNDLGGCAANNGWGVFLNPNTSSETWTSTLNSGTEAAAVWAAQADIYKSAAAGAGTYEDDAFNLPPTAYNPDWVVSIWGLVFGLMLSIMTLFSPSWREHARKGLFANGTVYRPRELVRLVPTTEVKQRHELATSPDNKSSDFEHEDSKELPKN